MSFEAIFGVLKINYIVSDFEWNFELNGTSKCLSIPRMFLEFLLKSIYGFKTHRFSLYSLHSLIFAHLSNEITVKNAQT